MAVANCRPLPLPSFALAQDYRIGLVPASDTGAFEMAMWNLLGERPVDCFWWESFGKGWATDANTVYIQHVLLAAELLLQRRTLPCSTDRP